MRVFTRAGVVKLQRKKSGMERQELEQRFRHNLLQHCGISCGQRLLVAVSGGSDSVALLRLLHRCIRPLGLQLVVAHLDHGLRPASGADAVFVARLAAGLGWPAVFGFASVAQQAQQQRLGLEEAGRQARYDFLYRQAHRLGCAAILLGHQQEDQAETLMLRLLRGTAVSGLAAMAWRSGLLARPLLDCGRDELLSFLALESQDYVTDASNAELCFSRNRLRHQLWPQLQQEHPGLSRRLAQLAQRVAVEEDYWQQQLQPLLLQLEPLSEGFRLSLERLRPLHPALRARLLREVLRWLRGDVQGLAAGHYAQLETLVQAADFQGVCCLPRAVVVRTRTALEFLRRLPVPAQDVEECAIPGPGRYPLPGGWLEINQVPATAAADDRCRIYLSSQDLRWPLQLRSARPGDRLAPLGMEGHKRLKDLFVEWRLERQQRWQTPLLCQQERVLWVVGYRRSRLLLPQPHEQWVWRVDFQALAPKSR